MIKSQPIITQEDLDKIYNAPIKAHASQLFKANTLIMLLVDTGARISEITSLLVSDIDLEAKLILFRDTKNGDDRRVPVTSIMNKRLKQLIGDRKGDVSVFNMNRRAAYQSLKRRLVASGVDKRIHPHSFRHNFITNKIRKGQPLPAIQAFVGHKSLQSTAAYCHFANEDDLRKVLEA